ncbi:MAG: twin-arginine translocase subunit TatC [Deltaproteobacteria bacterium]|jgi:sec-independent protein translocase protein TatC|nr:twin-arginine translocase subunit TatC [Deltaproteobacteria bacterium]
MSEADGVKGPEGGRLAGGDAPAAGASPTGEKELSFLDHLSELRSRLIRGLVAVIPAVFVAYELSGRILAFLSAPLKALLPPDKGLIATALPETFLIHLKIALWGGVFISAPFWLYQLWAFVAPGLYRSERRAAARLTAAGVALMAAGAAFAYYVVIPAGFSFFLGFGGGEVTVLPAVSGYLSLVMTLMIAFGAAFQLPLLLLFLAAAGLVDSARLSRFRRFAILLIVILAGFLTPPDVISQILMSIPLYLLYELSLFLIRGRERASAAREAAEASEKGGVAAEASVKGGGAEGGGGGKAPGDTGVGGRDN